MYCRQCGEKLTLRFCENEGLVPYCDKCEGTEQKKVIDILKNIEENPYPLEIIE